MLNKRISRLRRAQKTRAKIAGKSAVRLCVFRSNSHIYAQIISADSSSVLAHASTVESDVKLKLANGGNILAAKLVGERIASKAKELGIKKVSFDRSGFQYHGRVKALADAARDGGLEF